LVDGVPTTLDGLGSIPVANVQSIDIVTSPDARYDSEGTGGIISIVSKKQAPEAFSAMASANYCIDHFMNGNLAMSYNVERWGIRMNYNGKLEKDHIESELNRHVLQTGSDLEQLIDAAKKTTVHNIGLNFNYKATKRDILALDMKIGFPRMNNLQMMQNHYVTASSASDKLRRTDITFNREMVEGSLGYRHLFDPGRREVSIMLSLSAINGHRPSYYYEAADIANPFQQVQRSKSGGRPRIAAFQIDYMTPVGKGNLETGVKMTYRNNNIDHKMYEYDAPSDSWQLSIPLSNDLRHREYIPAAYAMYSSKFSSKLTYKAGLRLEYSRVTLQNDKEHLDEASNCFFVAPNLMLNYRVSKPWQMSLGVSRRISRPTYPQLNPYVNLIDNQTYETGNVRLEPEKVNKLDIGYSYAGQTLRVVGNAYLNYSQDYINQITYLDQSILVMSYINSDMDIKTGIEHNIRWNALRWLDIDLGSNIFYAKSRADWQGTSFSNQGWTANNSATLNMTPRKGMTIQAQYFVTSPQYFPQFATKTIHYCNLGIRQQLPKTGLTFSALLTDIFNTRRWDISSDNPVYTLVNTSKNRSRVLWFGISWNFHSRKSVGAQKGGTQRPGESQGGRQQEEDRSIIRLGE
jgi:outer membrane receptor protein involved in Fe transport